MACFSVRSATCLRSIYIRPRTALLLQSLLQISCIVIALQPVEDSMAEGHQQQDLQLTLVPMNQLAEVSVERTCVCSMWAILETHRVAC